ncbi:MAG: DUF58 domain-containing protein [Phycisphaerae bacterium]|jgi:uncharacterized protein (DUF58 family)|nr:DUF58 domain-containing protein [Phycisphaerae bacterium]
MDASTFLHRLRQRDESSGERALPGARFLTPSDMQRLRHLEFSTVRRVRGTFSGRHSSRQRGQSVEFNDYRQYMPGDDPGDVDWKVYGRTDRLFIKLYEHESELTTTLLVDGSASMAFRGCDAPLPGAKLFDARGARIDGGHRSKYELAGSIAAALSFLLIQRNDRVAMGIARQGLAAYERPGVSMTHLRQLLGTLDAQDPSGIAVLPEAIEATLRRTRRRGMLVVISDFLDDCDATIGALAQANARGHEIVLFHVLHADEVDLPRGGAGLFIDSESGERVRVHVDDIRAEYTKAMEEFNERLRRMCLGLGFDRVPIHTGEDHFAMLERYLLRRGARRT